MVRSMPGFTPIGSMQATGDFNGDGRDDVLLRHGSGWLAEWLAQPNGNFSGNNTATTWIHPDWHVAGGGDFNNDTYDDLLLRHQDGTWLRWL